MESNPKEQPSSTSVKPIQRRLVLVLVRAFLVVAVVGVVALLALTITQISRNTGRNPYFRNPNAAVLEAYYLGKGSWDGVETIIQNSMRPESRFLMMDWERSVLLDASGNVIFYFGQLWSNNSGQAVQLPVQYQETALMVNGKEVGKLITEKPPVPQPIRLTLGALNPIFFVALLLILLTVIIGVLLMRRFVNPLAEVIAAAGNVAKGNLSTRVKLKNSKDDLYLLGSQFNQMTETLERNDRERREMLADIAHELRTPLTIMRGRLEGIMDEVYPPTMESIAPALEETYLLERLVDDLHLLTLAETRQLHLEMKSTNLVDLLVKTVTVFEPQAASRKVKILYEPAEKKLYAIIDPQRMEQVIGNLIGNALRFVPVEGIIQIQSSSQNGRIQIVISDNGPGVKEEDLPLLFDRFWRGEKSRTRATGGAGLGLAICKQLVEAQGGRISAQNNSEGGLKVIIELPAANK